MESQWRTESRKVILSIMAAIGTKDMVLLKREISKAYPFGDRKYFPYKIWCDEVRKQLGIPKKTKGNERQSEMFEN